MNNINAPCITILFILTRTTTTKTITATPRYSTEKTSIHKYVEWFWMGVGMFICCILLTIILLIKDNTCKCKNCIVLWISKGNCMS